MNATRKPVWTEILKSAKDFRPDPGTTYICATSVEERSEHPSLWRGIATGVRFVNVFEQDRVSFAYREGSSEGNVKLRSQTQLAAFLDEYADGDLFVDITGLGHHIWAPLLKAAWRLPTRIRVVYVEPLEYQRDPRQREGSIYDLSERIQGVAPIPGFASIARPSDQNVCFVPLLGFEGARFAHMLEMIQPEGDNIVPVIGVPGFQADYPFHTYQCNMTVLKEWRSWHRVRYAAANCPFCLYYELEDIALENQGSIIKLGLIGTKPHALGAILFAIADESRPVEIVYDHPIRKAKRTTGASRLLVYDITALKSGMAN